MDINLTGKDIKMHRGATKWSSLLVVLIVVTMGVSQTFSQTVNWKDFSIGIKMALKSQNQGLQESAVCMIVKYGTKLDLDESIEDLVKFYRNQQAEQIRKLTLLAIYQLDEQKAFDLLAEQFEADQREAIEFITTRYSM